MYLKGWGRTDGQRPEHAVGRGYREYKIGIAHLASASRCGHSDGDVLLGR